VWDKAGLEPFARGLVDLGIELVSSGGTATALADAGIPVTRVEDVTGAPEMLDGRVKTLHPAIHGGLLADRSKPDHLADLERQGIAPIDLVVSNLYPFVASPDIETIDIGGPAMVRAASKNHAFVGVITRPDQYDAVLDELRANDSTLGDDTRTQLALDAFAMTSAYDAAIVDWLQRDEQLPRYLTIPLERAAELRYGENPHQHAARYRTVHGTSWWDGVVQHAGMALSYLNLYDTEAAWRLVHDLGDQPAAAIIKHANPCGAAVAATIADAYELAFECDEKSAFGGIVALNRPVDDATAERMVAAAQADVIIAPGWLPGTIDKLIAKRKNTRLLEGARPDGERWHLRQIGGGLLVEEPHQFVAGRDQWRVVTKAEPTEEQWRDAEMAWRLVGHVKSNAVVLVASGQAVGIGAGQQSRVDAGEIATKKAAGRAKGGASATDAFYPFRDGLDVAAAAGVAVVIQPGGSINDEQIIAAADEHGLAMVFTGERHFLH
jgi:phosphoribosylaminoimidazolecarboxamide formyltransferase/IMP cyclohydrolase